MTTPRTITQRLDTQHPALLGEVISDLQVLRGEKLRERIAQWQVYLSYILDEGGEAQDIEALNILLSPHKQLAFLQEHLQIHHIIGVLTSINPTSNLIKKYLKQKAHLTLDDPDVGEILVAGAYLNYIEGSIPPYMICKDLILAINILQTKGDTIGKVTPVYGQNNEESRGHIQQQTAQGCELFGRLVTLTKQKRKYKKAADMYTTAYQCLVQSRLVRDTSDIDLIMYTARAYRNLGDLEVPRDYYLQAIAGCNNLLEQLETEDPTHGCIDPVYADWKIRKAQLLHDDATQKLLSSDLFYIQLILEDIQNKRDNQQGMLRAIQDELNDMYDRLKKKKWIASGTPSAYEVANLWRFTYGWYMMLVDEPLYAVRELRLLDKQVTPQIILQAAKILLKGDKISFVDSPKEKSANCIKVDLYSGKKKT